MTSGRILITGASGFTGLHACDYFAQLGFEVVALVRRAGTTAGTAVKAAGFVRERLLDLTDAESVREMLAHERPDYVLHLAGLNAVKESWQHPIGYMQVNVMSTLYMLEALRQVGLSKCRTLIAGSMLGCRIRDDEAPRPSHPYGLSKTIQTLTAQAWSHLFELPVWIAQPSNLVGPGASNGICGLIGSHIAGLEATGVGKPFNLHSLTESRDFVDVRDVVRGYALILEQGKPGTVYPIGSGELRTLGEIAVRFTEQTKAPVTWLVTGRPEPISASDIQGDPAVVPSVAPISHVNMEPMGTLGWQPLIPIHQSAADILTFFRSRASVQEKGERG